MLRHSGVVGSIESATAAGQICGSRARGEKRHSWVFEISCAHRSLSVIFGGI